MTDRSRISEELAGRLGRLPWITFHTRIVLAVGAVWALAGLAANAVAAVGLAPVRDPAWMGGAAGAFLLGEAVGVLGGGAAARRWGRRRMLWGAVAVFVAANAVPAVLPGGVLPGTGPPGSMLAGLVAYVAVRFAAGVAGGAEYAAVLDAVAELIPRARRTPVLLAVNGLYWLGGLLGAAAQFALAQPGAVPGMTGWRAGLLVAPVLGLLLAGACGLVPESPSWLVRAGRTRQAAAIVDTAECDARAAGHTIGRAPASRAAAPGEAGAGEGVLATLGAMVRAERLVTVRAVVLCASQGGAYGAVVFTLVAVVTGVYRVGDAAAPAYAVAFAAANLVGAVVLGRLLDPGGQGLPFAVAHMWVGGPLALAGVLLARGVGSAWLTTLLLCLAFLIAAPSTVMLVADAAAHYPEPLRRPAARVLSAVVRLGGVPGPLLFGALLAERSRGAVSLGFVAAAVSVVVAGLVAVALRTPAVDDVPESPFEAAPHPGPYVRPAAPARPRGPDAPWSFPAPPSRARRDDADR
ncbi:MAG TPA: MFS transporter [Streptosporangiaceae bacterium]